MPSKRTNDSVDRILEDLNIQQAQADQTEAGHDEKRCQHQIGRASCRERV